jgi:hypothetical protein
VKILRGNEQGMEPFTSWAGETPFYVIIEAANGARFVIDLDEPGWMSEIDGLMRLPGTWVLMVKRFHDRPDGVPMLAVVVGEGDQPYYTKHTVGIAVGPGAGGTLAAYGIGKKRLDGTTERMWIMPNGVVCSGDDVDIIGVEMLQSASSQATG